MVMTGAQALVRGLEAEEVDIIFGYPGGAILPVYDALINSSIKHILVRQEQAAVHAAGGYARLRGKTGVCIATSGPGATNLVTGIANAYMDSVPVVVITGQVSTEMVGTDAFQEVDITGITHPITKHNYLVQDTKDIPRIIKEAFHIAGTGRPGPVLIDLPKNVAENECWEEIPQRINLDGYKPTIKGHPSQIKTACRIMKEARCPVIHAGGGIVGSDAASDLIKLAESIQAPVATTLMGLGAIPADHELFLGMLGIHGTTAANRAVSECDLLITIGARFDDRVTGAVGKFAPDAKIIHIDIDPAEIGKNIRVNVPIVGHVKMVLQAINNQVEKGKRSQWLARIKRLKEEAAYSYPEAGKTLTTRGVIERLSALTKGNAVVTTDVGQHQMFAAQFYRVKHPRAFLSSGGLGTMGYGFPAAVGAQLADPKALVVCITGDGSFQMSMAELATAKEHNLPVKVLVFNNNCLGLVRQLQHFYCERRYTAVNMTGNPDFVKLAQAYGVPGYRISNVEEIDQVLEEALNNGKLSIVECMIEKEELVYPTVLNGKGLDEMVISTGGYYGE
ncbi:MAG: biosynthetic-type acetolactate synthase large subunit [Desulfitobacteriaceae bacterium]|nr:biosynthetic-type acetolactate synthase large subunit [Desulfitobacteriaceae bacterium]MDD4752129.1 biosynthetic-type acetolactate synthase large subunit [Desulfitobacteriaceae bacterium]